MLLHVDGHIELQYYSNALHPTWSQRIKGLNQLNTSLGHARKVLCKVLCTVMSPVLIGGLEMGGVN